MGALRILQTSQVTVTRTFYVDETPTDATGNVDVSLQRWDGTVVNSGTAGHPGPAGQYTWTIRGGLAQADPSDTYQLDKLQLIWTALVGGARTRVAQEVEIVGGHVFDLAQFRADYPDFGSKTKFTTAALAARRVAVEQEIERVTWTAMVPRFAYDITWGSGSRWLGLNHCDIRAVRKVVVDGTTWTPAQLAAIDWMDNGLLVLPVGAVWPAGVQVVVEYEHGLDGPPEPVSEAAAFRMSTRMGQGKSGVPANAQSYTTEAGAIYRLGQGNRDRTGIPLVDADLLKFGRKRRAASA